MTSPKYRPSASFLDQPSDSTTVRMGAPMSEIVLGGGDHFPYNGKAIKCSLCRTAANQITKQQKTMAAVIIPLAQRPWTTAANSTHDIWLYPKLLIAAVWQCTAVCNDSINGSAGVFCFLRRAGSSFFRCLPEPASARGLIYLSSKVVGEDIFRYGALKIATGKMTQTDGVDELTSHH